MELGFPSAQALCSSDVGCAGRGHRVRSCPRLQASAPLGPKAWEAFPMNNQGSPWCGGPCCWLAGGFVPRQPGYMAREGYGRAEISHVSAVPGVQDWRGCGVTAARLGTEPAGMRMGGQSPPVQIPPLGSPRLGSLRGRALPGGLPSEQRQGVVFMVKKSYKH